MPVRSIRSQPLAVSLALTGLVALAPTAARAADDPSPPQPGAPETGQSAGTAQPAAPAPDLDARVRELEETVRQLREALRQLQQPPAEPPKATVDQDATGSFVRDLPREERGFDAGFRCRGAAACEPPSA